jgi:hypothetical protein
MNWFAESFRKVHLLYVSPPWAKQRGGAFNTDHYADGLAEAGVDCVELYYNGAGSPGDPLKHGDLVSIEGHAPFYVRQSFIARWGKSSGKPFEILTAGGLPRFELGGGWNGFDQKPPTVMQLESAIALAHSGSTVIGQAPYPNGATDPSQFAGFAQVFQSIRTWEPWLRAPQGVNDVALLLAPKARTALAHWALMQDGAEAFHEALLDAHIQCNDRPLG